MRIERITDIAEILKCLPFEREIRRKGRDNERESRMLSFIQGMLMNPLYGFWIAYDDNENIKGYVSAIMNPIPGMERMHVLRIYAKQKDLFKQFESILLEWAKPYKVKIAQITVKNHVRAMQKVSGFIPVSVNMERKYI